MAMEITNEWKNSRLKAKEPQTQVRYELEANTAIKILVSQQGIKAEKCAKTPKQVIKARLDFQIGRVCRQQQRYKTLSEGAPHSIPFHAFKHTYLYTPVFLSCLCINLLYYSFSHTIFNAKSNSPPKFDLQVDL